MKGSNGRMACASALLVVATLHLPFAPLAAADDSPTHQEAAWNYSSLLYWVSELGGEQTQFA
jgi:hypothetical protein